MPHLLLVDDDPEALEWLSELAKGEGFTVAQADSLGALENLAFSDDELAEIDRYATESGINLWQRSSAG